MLCSLRRFFFNIIFMKKSAKQHDITPFFMLNFLVPDNHGCHLRRLIVLPDISPNCCGSAVDVKFSATSQRYDRQSIELVALTGTTMKPEHNKIMIYITRK